MGLEENKNLDKDKEALEQSEKESAVVDNNDESKADTPAGLERAKDNPDRLEPTRYGDWEKSGRCIDF